MASELAQPAVLRRSVAFAEAVTQGQITVEGIMACRASTQDEVEQAFARGDVPVVVDADGAFIKAMHPTALVEATLAKSNSGITINDAPIVIALGPGYEAGKDAHAVIETNRGHNLGRVYLQGCAESNTGVPGMIGGYTGERLLRSPCTGLLYGLRQIGEQVQAGETVAIIKDGENTNPVIAAISGILRGLVRDGLAVHTGMKVGDIDPRATREHCFSISDKSRAVAGGVLEAVMYLMRRSPW
ncbi:MAG: selenium-dependent molybdenum cofactor biosynthesis protein YqeB [Ktedonobacteraceae bacterium]